MTRAYTAYEACQRLDLDAFDIVFLDHDLVEAHYTQGESASDVPTGVAVAQHIVNQVPRLRLPQAVIVHSMNHEGAEAILGELRKLPEGVPTKLVRWVFNPRVDVLEVLRQRGNHFT